MNYLELRSEQHNIYACTSR